MDFSQFKHAVAPAPTSVAATKIPSAKVETFIRVSLEHARSVVSGSGADIPLTAIRAALTKAGYVHAIKRKPKKAAKVAQKAEKKAEKKAAATVKPTETIPTFAHPKTPATDKITPTTPQAAWPFPLPKTAPSTPTPTSNPVAKSAKKPPVKSSSKAKTKK